MLASLIEINAGVHNAAILLLFIAPVHVNRSKRHTTVVLLSQVLVHSSNQSYCI